MTKAIEITVMRVSSDGKYIEFIINCPSEYFFTEFTVNREGSEDVYSLRECLFVESTCEDTCDCGDDTIEYEDACYYNKHYYAGRFEISSVGATGPDIYEITLEATLNEDAELEEDEEYPEVLTAEAYISDVSKAYYCLLNDIIDSGESLCSDNEKMDTIIRNYLILYAHLEALRLKDLEDARRYFTLLQNCFKNCGDASAQFMGGSCRTCNGGFLSESIRFNTYKPSCGCVQ